jgi:hypothetical protein
MIVSILWLRKDFVVAVFFLIVAGCRAATIWMRTGGIRNVKRRPVAKCMIVLILGLRKDCVVAAFFDCPSLRC